MGWGNTSGYIPYPGGGEKWGGNGVGDDLYSYGFDGEGGAMPNHTILYHTISYRTLPYRTILPGLRKI